MSQPEDFGPLGYDPLAIPLESNSQLLEVFRQAEKTQSNHMMGIEYEMFAHDMNHDRPLAYEGATSINELFFHLAKRSTAHEDPFIPVIEEGNVVALRTKRAVIALEPGGQIEIAARPQKDLHLVNEIFDEVARELHQAAHELNIRLFAIGIHPLARQRDMAVVKKSRYDIMHAYMAHLPGLGLDMMTRSCAIQLNLDYQSETDMVKKMRLAMRLMPFFSLLCSSASFVEGKPTTKALPRGNIWHETDPTRTGIPSMIFSENFGYQAWIDWALDVPMYFIRRGIRYVDVAGSSFREFMAHGLKGEKALVRDFVDHLSTIFTEVRLKPYLELRSPDSLPINYAKALNALCWALFYGNNAFKSAQEMLAPLHHEELMKLHLNVINHGQETQWQNRPIFSALKDLLALAQEEFREQPRLAAYLAPFTELVEQEASIASRLRKHFRAIDTGNLLNLIERMDILSTTAG